MRRIHDHHDGEGGSIRECDCPNPTAPEPSWAAQDVRAIAECIDQHEAQVDSLAPPTLLPWLRHVAREHRHRHHPRLYLRPQHIGPSAVVVGVTAYLLASLLPWWWALVAIAGLLQLVVTVGQRVEVDRTPRAQLLRR